MLDQVARTHGVMCVHSRQLLSRSCPAVLLVRCPTKPTRGIPRERLASASVVVLGCDGVRVTSATKSVFTWTVLVGMVKLSQLAKTRVCSVHGPIGFCTTPVRLARAVSHGFSAELLSSASARAKPPRWRPLLLLLPLVVATKSCVSSRAAHLRLVLARRLFDVQLLYHLPT